MKFLNSGNFRNIGKHSKIVLFKDFLVKGGVLEKYLNSAYLINLEDLKGENPNNFIDSYFIWADSPEGNEFWNHVNNKWLELLKN